MGLVILIIGLVLFIAPHVLVSLRDIRAKLIAWLGERPYKGVISVVSILGVVLIVYGFALYRRTGLIPVWSPPYAMRYLTEALMWPSFVLFAAAYIPGTIKKALPHRPRRAGRIDCP